MCPACSSAMRRFGQRLCCDPCDGIFLTIADLARSIDELVHLEPAVVIAGARPGKRSCPTCSDTMALCQVELAMLAQVVRPRVELDHCAAHGLWFDGGELADLFLAVERKFSTGGSSGPGGSGSSGSGFDGPLGSYGKFNAPP